MTFFDDVVGKLFGQSKENSPLISEPLFRSESFLEDFNRWSKSYKRKDLNALYFQEYKALENGASSEVLFQLRTSRSNGLIFMNQDKSKSNDFQFYFDWLAKKVLELEYKRSNADVTIIDQEGVIETVEKYYLKPKTELSTKPIAQKFGNILIELFKKNDEYSHIKLLANNYSDRNYQKHFEFEFLAEYLLTED